MPIRFAENARGPMLLLAGDRDTVVEPHQTPRLAAAVRAHGDRTVAFCEAHRDVTLLTPADRAHRAGVLALRPRDLVAASQRLKDRGVYHSVREGHVRLSPHFYTTAAEIDRALEIVAGA